MKALFAGGLLCAAMAGGSASALTITDTFDIGAGTVSYLSFYAPGGSYDIFTSGPTIDPVVYLFSGIVNALTGPSIAFDDDSCPDSFCGVAGSYWNALIDDLTLTAGIYTLAVMDYSTIASLGEAAPVLTGPVTVTISNEDPYSTVPLPAAMPLLALALGGLGIAARRRKAG